jgi:hypothetical protein
MRLAAMDRRRIAETARTSLRLGPGNVRSFFVQRSAELVDECID